MPDDAPKLPSRPRRPISDPSAAANVTESDIDAAVQQFKRDVPPQYRDLLQAEAEKEDDGERI